MKTELTIGGTYRHYKGNLYEVVGVAKHSETLEELVIYRALYGERELWARPKEMFLEEVETGGKKLSRFELAKDLKKNERTGFL
ncbi:MAG: DUF1653 domain-containing protein [Rickettsiales bacterium]|jgi:hypothetical protein|nr:DUF1653 domain-containing protein [Rickettsiales bacterium]